MAEKKIAKSKELKKEKTGSSGISDKEFRRIQNELTQTKNRSILIEQDIQKLRDKLSLNMFGASTNDNPTVINKKFRFRCDKCVGEFEHNAKIAVLDHKVICPKCKKEHLLALEPHQGKYRVKIPKSIKQVK
jgi:formylmethanofuran dehydrogenase subunit E